MDLKNLMTMLQSNLNFCESREDRQRYIQDKINLANELIYKSRGKSLVFRSLMRQFQTADEDEEEIIFKLIQELEVFEMVQKDVEGGVYD